MTPTRAVTSKQTGAALFDTAIGRVGVAWQEDLIVGVQLPERNDAATLRRLSAQIEVAVVPTAPPPTVEAAMAAMGELLDGKPTDLDFIELDLTAIPPFDRAVYDVTRSIPPGQSLTYGQVAERLGDKGAARAVGRALGANRCPIVIPCHRVLGAGGQMTGFSANGGVETKRKMLLIEGCPAVPPSLFD